MNSLIIILLGMQACELILTFYVLAYMKEMEEKRLAEKTVPQVEDRKGMSEERKKKIAESQKRRWAKKKGATNLIAPVAWPEESRQAVN